MHDNDSPASGETPVAEFSDDLSDEALDRVGEPPSYCSQSAATVPGKCKICFVE